MTTELKTVNFNVNNPTQNGRKYDTMNLLEQLADMAFQRKLLISTNMDIPLDVQSVIGVVHQHLQIRHNLRNWFVEET